MRELGMVVEQGPDQLQSMDLRLQRAFIGGLQLQLPAVAGGQA